MPSGIDTLSLIFPYSNIEGKEDEVISKIRKAVSPDHIELEKGIAMLAVVGRGMRRTRGTAARIFALYGSRQNKCKNDRSGLQ